MKHKLESSLPGKIRYTDDAILIAESKEELKSLLMKVKEESEKFSLKLSIKKTKIWLKTQHSENKDEGIQSHYFMPNRWENNGQQW